MLVACPVMDISVMVLAMLIPAVSVASQQRVNSLLTLTQSLLLIY